MNTDNQRIPPNRVIALLTPLVFAPAAGSISALAAKYGLQIDGGSLQAIFIAGAGIALAEAAHWTKGWQEHEKRQDTERIGLQALAGTTDVDFPHDDEEYENIDGAIPIEHGEDFQDDLADDVEFEEDLADDVEFEEDLDDDEELAGEDDLVATSVGGDGR